MTAPCLSRIVGRTTCNFDSSKLSKIYNHDMDSPLRTFKAQVFQALAHPTRIAIVEALRDGEVSGGGLLAQLPVEAANLSQHLSVLRSKQVVIGRKEGNQVYFSLRDPVLIQVLDLLKQYFNTHLSKTAAMLDEMTTGEKPRV